MLFQEELTEQIIGAAIEVHRELGPGLLEFTTETQRHGENFLNFMLFQEELTEQIIGAAIEVHRELGPGLLESAYEECLCHEVHLRNLRFQRQANLPVGYKGLNL